MARLAHIECWCDEHRSAIGHAMKIFLWGMMVGFILRSRL